MATAAKRKRSGSNPQGNPGTSASHSLGSFKIPLALTVTLFLLSFTPRVQASPMLAWSFWGACIALLLWQLILFISANRAGESHEFSIALRPQHYIQAMVQISLYAYWGYYWRPVYEHFWLICGQLLFAYTFDMLLSWSRRRDYSLGFGPFPIILSINLFIWFRDDWFYLQFLMIAVGFMGKEYVRWQREGRNVHIFNPSAFALGLFSLILIMTNTTSLTWGQEIASTLTLAPNIYAFLFLIGLVVMYFFSITLVVGMAAITLFGLSALYSSSTGVPYFLDSEIPAAVFLGLHLLITDPSTSPRTPLGKSMFGVLYGFGVFGLYTLLGNLGAPTFYDKLLCVPLLNLSVIAIDRAVRAIHSESLLSVWRTNWLGGRANLAHMSVWILFFAGMSLWGKTDGRHTGDSLPFWQQACASDLPNACGRLLQLESTYCGDNAAWACNELGAHYQEGQIVEPDTELALSFFGRACELKFQAGCLNLLDTEALSRDSPHELDLRLLLREGGLNLMNASITDLYARACEHDWSFACAEGRGRL
ncbi:MAG: SEL1-like repeat protein [Pseudomonadales bacterium]|jgi:hypothetical protein|nr:SEL1-like repeat protein [Pseudomonadales bacterium]